MSILSWFHKEKRGSGRHEDPDEAIARYLEDLRQADVLGTAPPAAALNGLGDAYLDKGDSASAADYYRQSGEAYAREGMYDNAIACCKKIRRYAPAEEQASLLLGRYYAAKGLRADAARELEGYADRMDRAGRKKEAMVALTELVQLAPGRPLQREKLARLHAEHGQHDAALEEYRVARSEYQQLGDAEGADRMEERIAEDKRHRPSFTASSTAAAEAPPTPEGPADPAEESGRAEPAGDAPVDPPPIPLDLEIERTSYAAEPAGVTPDAAPGEPSGGMNGPGESAPPLSEFGGEAADEAGEGGDLAAAAARLGKERRWEEAVDAYRELARAGGAQDEQLAAWTEAARQAGMASLVLEALSFQAHWHLEAGRRSSARRAAEEMLLVDPRNDVATEILNKVGSTLPRD